MGCSDRSQSFPGAGHLDEGVGVDLVALDDVLVGDGWTLRRTANPSSYIRTRPRDDFFRFPTFAGLTLVFLLCPIDGMTDRPASWRMPTPKQIERLAAEAESEARVAGRRARGAAPARILAITASGPPSPLQQSENPSEEVVRDTAHLLRVACRRCGRTVEIQKVDAVRLYGRTGLAGNRANGCSTTPASNGPAATKKTAAGRRSISRRRAAGRCPDPGCSDGAETSSHPLSGGDRKALNKELGNARAMTKSWPRSRPRCGPRPRPLQQADRLLCESWNERMWSDGEPIDPSPTIDQAINGGFSGSRSGAPAARRRATSTWRR